MSVPRCHTSAAQLAEENPLHHIVLNMIVYDIKGLLLGTPVQRNEIWYNSPTIKLTIINLILLLLEYERCVVILKGLLWIGWYHVKKVF